MQPIQQFHDRSHAGRVLADAIDHLGEAEKPADPIVLALPRGGVPVARETARRLHAPLDVLVVRKLGVPGFPEQAMGAIASGGYRFMDPDVAATLGISDDAIEEVVRRERRELRRREAMYRGDRPEPELAGRGVVLIDDGLATGSSMLTAIQAVRARRPGRVVVAVPTAPPSTVRRIRGYVDVMICPLQPEPFGGVSRWYEAFEQTTDEEVCAVLDEARSSSQA